MNGGGMRKCPKFTSTSQNSVLGQKFRKEAVGKRGAAIWLNQDAILVCQQPKFQIMVIVLFWCPAYFLMGVTQFVGQRQKHVGVVSIRNLAKHLRAADDNGGWVPIVRRAIAPANKPPRLVDHQADWWEPQSKKQDKEILPTMKITEDSFFGSQPRGHGSPRAVCLWNLVRGFCSGGR
jgi:hypothetical protein